MPRVHMVRALQVYQEWPCKLVDENQRALRHRHAAGLDWPFELVQTLLRHPQGLPPGSGTNAPSRDAPIHSSAIPSRDGPTHSSSSSRDAPSHGSSTIACV